MSIFVLVHGAGHGAWCWERTEQDLAAAGLRSVSLDLPLTSLADDADAVRQVLDSLDEPAILVGHSYGGLVISEAAGGRSDVEQLVYVAAVLVGSEESVLDLAGDFAPTLLMEQMEYTPDGFMIFSPETARNCFYHETPAEVAEPASLRMRPTAAVGMTTTPGSDPWQSVPTTFIICERDRAMSPDMQRAMAKKAGRVESIDTDHSPFVSRPEEFCRILLSIAGEPVG
jgi:pimeloyl-ACP methyl ester carboxylesterase